MSSIDAYDGAKQRVAAIQHRLDTTVQQINEDSSIGRHGKRIQIAKATLDARRAVAKAKDEHQAEREHLRDGMRHSAFGNSGGPLSGSDQISARDAFDRAAKIGSPVEAKRLLRQAIHTGDTQLARAIASRAYDEGPRQTEDNHGNLHTWREVVNDYAETFNKSTSIDRLDDLPAGRHTNLADIAVFHVRSPNEVRAYQSDNDLQRLAEQNADRLTAQEANGGTW